jgi:hypothetical protein
LFCFTFEEETDMLSQNFDNQVRTTLGNIPKRLTPPLHCNGSQNSSAICHIFFNISSLIGSYFHDDDNDDDDDDAAVDTVVCAPDDGWSYHPKNVEQFPYINKLCKVASCWIYIEIYLRCTDP